MSLSLISPQLRTGLRLVHRACMFLVLSVLSVLACAQPKSPFLTVELPGSVRVQLPRNWRVLSENQQVTLDAWVSAWAKKSFGESSESALGFAANYYDDNGKTAGIFNVRYYRDQTATQEDVRSLTGDEVGELDTELKKGLTKGAELAGNRMLEWKGTQKRVINGLIFLVTEYRRSSPQGIPFRARLIRLLDGPRSFTVTVSYREDQQFFLAPIAEHITESIRR